MKKQFFIMVLALSLSSGLFVPAVFAEGNSPEASSTDAVCRLLVNKLNAYETKVGKEKSDLESRKGKQIPELKKDHLAKQELKLEAVDTRSIFGGKQFRALESRAGTTVERQAITDFKMAILHAVTVRQTAMNNAFNEFHRQMLKVVDDYDASVNKAVSARASAIASAVAKAKTDCLAGVTPNLIRSQFNAKLNASENTFKEDQRKVDDVRSQETVLINIRKAKYDEAVSDFKAAVNTATANLKAAFTH